ncbi:MULTISPECIES: hypothetical protein [unclassified Mameliella]|uniref:hypothetical protein n=1 Tax=unclassified Mameliella TaxID=2630630 RepID=UPI00273D0984|nr:MULTISPECIES: hypothetical protein [unclassified Mameliella]
MDAHKDQQFGPRDHLGFARNVNVKGSGHDADNAAIVDATPQEVFEWIAAKIARLGWHIVVHFAGQELVEAAPLVRRLAGIVVVNRMGRPDVTEGVEDTASRAFMDVFKEFLSAKVRCGWRRRLQHPRPGRSGEQDTEQHTQRQDGHA